LRRFPRNYSGSDPPRGHTRVSFVIQHSLFDHTRTAKGGFTPPFCGPYASGRIDSSASQQSDPTGAYSPHAPQCDRPNGLLHAMRRYLIQSAVIKIIDRRFNPWILPARRNELRRRFRA